MKGFFQIQRVEKQDNKKMWSPEYIALISIPHQVSFSALLRSANHHDIQSASMTLFS